MRVFQVKHIHCLTKPLAVAALWPDGEGLPALDDALDVFLTLPGDTNTREDDVQPFVSVAMRLPVPQTGHPAWGAGIPTQAWGLVERAEPGLDADAIRGIVCGGLCGT